MGCGSLDVLMEDPSLEGLRIDQFKKHETNRELMEA